MKKFINVVVDIALWIWDWKWCLPQTAVGAEKMDLVKNGNATRRAGSYREI